MADPATIIKSPPPVIGIFMIFIINSESFLDNVAHHTLPLTFSNKYFRVKV